jgi:hypothetical protein
MAIGSLALRLSIIATAYPLITLNPSVVQPQYLPIFQAFSIVTLITNRPCINGSIRTQHPHSMVWPVCLNGAKKIQYVSYKINVASDSSRTLSA